MSTSCVIGIFVVVLSCLMRCCLWFPCMVLCGKMGFTSSVQRGNLHRPSDCYVRFRLDMRCDTALRDLSNCLRAICDRFRFLVLWGRSGLSADSRRTSRRTIPARFRACRRVPMRSVLLWFLRLRFSFGSLLFRYCCRDSCHRSLHRLSSGCFQY